MSKASKKPILIIRADASRQMGTGHLMRCLALAQGWKQQGQKTVFVTGCKSAALKRRIQDEGFPIIELQHVYPDPRDLQVTREILAAYPQSWLVLDGYHFDSAYQYELKNSGCANLLVIDDLARLDHYYADVVLNQNISAPKLSYPVEPYTRLLLGTNFVLLRHEFNAWRDCKPQIRATAKKILVTMGGSDPANLTPAIIRALSHTGILDLEVVVVAGTSNMHREAIKEAADSSPFPVSLAENPQNMPELMSWADLAVSAGGTTTWELAYMGVPAFLLPIAENQRNTVEILKEQGYAGGLDHHEDMFRPDLGLLGEKLSRFIQDKNSRAIMSLRGRQLVDGCGLARVLGTMAGEPEDKIYFRPVEAGDCMLLWQWANDPEVRANSFSTGNITWEQHIQWFEKMRKDPHTLHFMAIKSDYHPVGQVRFHIQDGNAVISLSISRAFRGRGYGPVIISAAVKELLRIATVSAVSAYIKPQNQASLKSFAKAGFKPEGTIPARSGEAVHLRFTAAGMSAPRDI